jgi:hypothetical protein
VSLKKCGRFPLKSPFQSAVKKKSRSQEVKKTKRSERDTRDCFLSLSLLRKAVWWWSFALCETRERERDKSSRCSFFP